MRKIKIVKKKLRKYWGWAYKDQDKIEIDPRARQKTYLNTLIHEILHILYPLDSETRILQNANTIAKYIWEEGYRKNEKKE